MASSVSLVRARNSRHMIRFAPQNTPAYVRDYLRAIATRAALNAATLETDVINYLTNAGCAQPVRPAVSSLMPAAGRMTHFYECPHCRRIHLHPAGGVCTDCLTPLKPPQPLTPAQLLSDYYSYLATQTDELFRLNCEELTGQTNKADGRKRQRLFQDVVLPGTENRTNRSDRSAERHHDDGSRRRYRRSAGRDDGEHAADAFQLSAEGWPRWPAWRRPLRCA